MLRAQAVIISAVVVSSGVYLAYRRFRVHLCAVQLGRHMVDGKALDFLKHDSVNPKITGTAVVCGGSLAGLLAARVCHKYFEKVVIIESEEWVHDGEGVCLQPWTQTHSRARVIQYHQTQSTQVYTYIGYRTLFPNFEEESRLFGMRILPADFQMHFRGQKFGTPVDEYGGELPKCIFASRQGLETLTRRLVFDKEMYPSIERISGTVNAVIPDTDSRSLKGISLITKAGEKVTLDAALVIDCTGPTQGSIKWLTRHWWAGQTPDFLKLQYDPRMRFSTFKFRITPELCDRLPVPGGFTNCGAIYNCLVDQESNIWTQRIEGNILMVCCGGYGNEVTPMNLPDIIAYAEAIHSKLIVDFPSWFIPMLRMLVEVESSVTLSHLRIPLCYFNRFHEASNLPSNWIALGDSVMRLNPIYAQGCTKTMMGAVTLDEILGDLLRSFPATRIPSGFSRGFFRAQNCKIAPIWNSTKNTDYGYKTTLPIPGETTSIGRWSRWYLSKLNAISFTDEEAMSTLWHVKMFLFPSFDYYRPSLLFKVASQVLSQLVLSR